MLERAGHVADVRRRAEHERVRGEHVNSGRGQRRGDHDVDPRFGELRVTGARHDRFEHRAQRWRGRVVDNEQPRHPRTSGNQDRGCQPRAGPSFSAMSVRICA
jgi:hypothetical protein